MLVPFSGRCVPRLLPCSSHLCLVAVFTLGAIAQAAPPSSFLSYVKDNNLTMTDFAPPPYASHLSGAPDQRRRNHLDDFLSPLPQAPAILTPDNDTPSYYVRRHSWGLLTSPLISPSRDECAGSRGDLISVAAFGGDPTGVADSTAAFAMAMGAALKRWDGSYLAEGIKNLGGAVISLGGGRYSVSAPVVIPRGYGNLHMRDGTIKASDTFPHDCYVVAAGSDGCTGDDEDLVNFNEHLSFSNLMLDGSNVAYGVLWLHHTIGAVVGTNLFLGFQQRGVYIRLGHEVVVESTWMGQYLFSDERKQTSQTATAIYISANDHVVSNVVIFSALVGVVDKGAGNTFVGLHSWNGSGTSFISTGYNTRILGCYPDFNDVILENPYHVTVTNSFFLGGAQIVLRANRDEKTARRPPVIRGLIIRTNTFDFSDESIIQLHGEFDSVSDTFIGGNIVSNNMTAVSTSSTRQLHLTNATEWEFDLSDELLFATIQRVQYSLELDDGQPLVRHASRPAKGTHVVVETDVPVSGTVTVWVDQSKMSQMGGLSA